MKKNIDETRKQGWYTLLALVIIAFAVYIGFTPLFNLIEDGIASRVIGSSFGAIFVIILTMFLLNKQTEIEQESKKSERVFDEKVKIYQMILDITRDMLVDGHLSKSEVNRLPFPLLRLKMLSDNSVIETFTAVYNQINAIYLKGNEAEIKEDNVPIDDDSRNELYEYLSEFSNACRLDLEISDTGMTKELEKQTLAAISEVSSKGSTRDKTKFSFNGVDKAKNRYIYTVIKTYLDDNPGITINDFPNKVIERTPSDQQNRKNDFEIWKTYDEAIKLHEEKGSKRYFVTGRGGDYLKDKDLVLDLADGQICISNQWSIGDMQKFIDIMKSKDIRTK
jgi:hypothetical protein